VALSLATSVQGVKVMMGNQVVRKTDNIVYLEVLLEPDGECLI
jgi:hypothetical protein